MPLLIQCLSKQLYGLYIVLFDLSHLQVQSGAVHPGVGRQAHGILRPWLVAEESRQQKRTGPTKGLDAKPVNKCCSWWAGVDIPIVPFCPRPWWQTRASTPLAATSSSLWRRSLCARRGRRLATLSKRLALRRHCCLCLSKCVKSSRLFLTVTCVSLVWTRKQYHGPAKV